MIQNKHFMTLTLNLVQGKTSEVDPLAIWKNMKILEDSKNIQYFIAQVFRVLVMGQKKNTSVVQNQESMLATLMFLQFYNKSSKQSQKNVQQIQKLLSSRKNKIDGHSMWVLNMFLENDTKFQFAQDFISKLCFAPRDLTSIENRMPYNFEANLAEQLNYHRKMKLLNNQKLFKVLKNISSPQRIPQTKVLTFSYICFLDYMRGAKQMYSQVAAHLLEVLKGLVHTFRSSRKFQEFLITILHLIKNLAIMVGFDSAQSNIQIISWINQLRNQPGKLGAFAYQVFQYLHQELKSPGTMFRRKLRRDFPALDIKEATQIKQPCYLVTSKSSFLESPDYCSLMTLRKLIIYNGIGCSKYQNRAEIWKDIQGMGKQATYKAYYKTLKLIEQTNALQTYDKISSMQRQFLRDVLKYTLSTQKTKGKKQQNEEVQQFVQHQTPMNFFDYPTYQIRDVLLEEFINKNSENFNARLIQGYNSDVTEKDFYKSKIPIVFYGDQIEFSVFIRSLSVYLEQIKTSEINRLNIYIIPKYLAEFDLAQYLASRDLWYSRYVYNAFREKVFYPQFRISHDTNNTFPHYLLDKTLQMYLRQAQRSFNVNIWKCIIFFKGSSQPTQVFFYSHLLVGNSAECQFIKRQPQKAKKYSHLDYGEILTQKMKKFVSTTIRLRMHVVINSVDTNNKQGVKNLKQIKQDAIDFEDLMVCNLPYEYFMGKKPHPGNESLQMALLLQGNAKIYRKQLTNNDNFTKNMSTQQPKHAFHQAEQAFKDLWINYRIKFLEIENLCKQPMRIVIDNQPYTKVEKIMIAPACNENNQIISLPIKCFLPFEQ